MPIDKRIPRVLNSDLDSKTSERVSMEDALNLYSGPDNESIVSGVKLDGGDKILKNIKGNVEVFAHDGGLPLLNPRLVGAVEDIKTDITYLFVYSTNGGSQSIWAYDRYGKLPNSSENSLRLVYKSAQFNFPQNGLVKADIVYSNSSSTLSDLGEEFDKDAIIYFTDGVNEPRKINAYRALLAGSNVHGTSNEYSEADFITACPRTPLDPITFKFDNDPTRSSSNFSTVPGFQFAYQYVYKDGSESAISPYSDVAFPPSIVFQGANSYVDHSAFNECRLKIPLPPETEGQIQNISAVTEVASIKILAKQGKEGSFLIIDELAFDLTTNGGDLYVFDIPAATEDYEEWAYEYKFYNDKIGVGVSKNEVDKQYNAVPRSALAQTVSSNRLMYGNYLEGFNSVKTDCNATVVYKEAPESFLSYNVSISPSIEPIGSLAQNDGKSVGFVLDFSEMPESIPEGTEISISLTIAPDNNWHIYNFRGKSFHQTRQMGAQEQSGIDDLYEGVNIEQSLAENNVEAGGTYVTDYYGSMFGVNSGVKTIGQQWAMADSTNENSAIVTVPNNVTAYGTSAANPLVIKGGAVVFSAKVRSTEDIESNARQKINDAVHKALLNLDGIEDTGFEKLSANFQSTYSFDVGLFSGKRIKQDFIANEETATDPEAKLITAVKTTNGGTLPEPPGGYFIVNSAKVTLTLKEVDYEGYSVPNTSNHFRISVTKIADADVYSCIHATTSNTNEAHALDWIAVSKSDMIAIQQNEYNGIEGWLQSKGLDSTLKFHLSPVSDSTTETISRQIGYLLYDGVMATSEEFCLMDGEGGPGGGPSFGFDSDVSGYDYKKLYNQGTVTVNPEVTVNQSGVTTFAYDNTAFYTGKIGLYQGESGSAPFSTAMPMLYRVNNSDYEYPLPEPDPSNTNQIDPRLPNFKRLQSPAEIISNQFYISSLESLSARSFKTEAMHDFGIVYYDQRGRSSFVNPLKTVFVDGYSNEERPGTTNGSGSGKGRVEIHLDLLHEPPSWAHYYKIAYSNNTTVSDFIQYSAGGAFAVDDQEDTISESNQNIYVSLNYLQSHPVSYVNSFGARTPDGGMNMYKFQEGDKLKVISYFEGNVRKYVSYEFDVVDVVNLGLDNNPLAQNPEENQTGDFVVLKNNPSAFNFTHGDVFSGIHKWGNNCIIELRTPLKDLEADQRIFYEMPETYEVLRVEGGGFVHSPSTVKLKNGDVWFRPVATNVREIESGNFVDIIDIDDSNDPPAKPNFKNVFLESYTATDLFKADNVGLGRPNVIFKGAKEALREATITYSDQSDPESRRLRYSSFNPSTFNFKDLPETFGGIQYMGDRSDSVFVIQEDKISRVPVDRNVLSDVAGNNSIVSSREVLNDPIFYYGQSGCDSDPSSVFDSGEEVYFCNKTISKVYRWSVSTGIQELSSKGISSMLRAGLKRAVSQNQQVRIVGGYDPVKEEYLLSVVNVAERDTANVQTVKQELFVGADDPTDDTGFEDEVSPEISVSRDALGFGFVTIGTSGSNSLVISNEGNGLLEISGFIFTSDEYSSTTELPFSIEGGGSLEVYFEFSPNGVGQSNETLTIISNDPNTPQYEILLTGTGEEVETGDFTVAYNELFGTNITDEDMSAELAVNYLLELSNSDEEDQPTLGLMVGLFGAFPPVTQGVLASNSTAGDTDGDGVVTVTELLAFLEGFDPADYDLESSVYSPEVVSGAGDPPGTGGDDPTPFDPPGTGGPNPGPPAPGTGGEDPTPFDPGPIAESGGFSSVDEAINYLLFQGTMTVAEFNVLNQSVTPGPSLDFNHSGLVNQPDLLVFQQYWDTSISSGDSAFKPNSPGVGPGDPSILTSNMDAIDYLIADGTMTIGQYHVLLENVKDQARSDVDGSGTIGTGDLNIFFSVYSGSSIDPDNPFDDESPAFQ